MFFFKSSPGHSISQGWKSPLDVSLGQVLMVNTTETGSQHHSLPLPIVFAVENYIHTSELGETARAEDSFLFPALASFATAPHPILNMERGCQGRAPTAKWASRMHSSLIQNALQPGGSLWDWCRQTESILQPQHPGRTPCNTALWSELLGK